MSENDIKSMILFFFFAFLDEGKAIEASAEAIEKYRRYISKNPNARTSVVLILATKQIWQKNRGRIVRGHPNFHSESGWQFAKSVSMGPWKEFQKSALDEELLSLIWSQILKISDQDISSGLGISEGTLRYRRGRALRKLGALINTSQKTSLGVVRS